MSFKPVTKGSSALKTFWKWTKRETKSWASSWKTLTPCHNSVSQRYPSRLMTVCWAWMIYESYQNLNSHRRHLLVKNIKKLRIRLIGKVCLLMLRRMKSSGYTPSFSKIQQNFPSFPALQSLSCLAQSTQLMTKFEKCLTHILNINTPYWNAN